MLYTIQQLPAEPIYLVRIAAPLHRHKNIDAIDTELWRLAAGRGRIYRIDDFSALHPWQFTLSDARTWLTSDLREDAAWRGMILHMAVFPPAFDATVHAVYEHNDRYCLPVFSTVSEALSHMRLVMHRDIRR